jgi:hypothetical protein
MVDLMVETMAANWDQPLVVLMVDDLADRMAELTVDKTVLRKATGMVYRTVEPKVAKLDDWREQHLDNCLDMSLAVQSGDMWDGWLGLLRFGTKSSLAMPTGGAASEPNATLCACAMHAQAAAAAANHVGWRRRDRMLERVSDGVRKPRAVRQRWLLAADCCRMRARPMRRRSTYEVQCC